MSKSTARFFLSSPVRLSAQQSEPQNLPPVHPNPEAGDESLSVTIPAVVGTENLTKSTQILYASDSMVNDSAYTRAKTSKVPEHVRKELEGRLVFKEEGGMTYASFLNPNGSRPNHYLPVAVVEYSSLSDAEKASLREFAEKRRAAIEENFAYYSYVMRPEVLEHVEPSGVPFEQAILKDKEGISEQSDEGSDSVVNVSVYSRAKTSKVAEHVRKVLFRSVPPGMPNNIRPELPQPIRVQNRLFESRPITDLPKIFNVEGKDWTSTFEGVPVFNQGECGCCWAVAAIHCLFAMQKIKNPEQAAVMYSMDDLLFRCKRYIMDKTLIDKRGGFPFAFEQAFTEIMKYGVCTGQDWYKHCFRGGPWVGGFPIYGYCTAVHEYELLLAVQHHPVPGIVDDFPCFHDWDKSLSDMYEGPENGDTTWLGTHAILIVGYDRDAWIVRNSWGDKWGDRGMARINRHVRVRHAWNGYEFRPLILKAVFSCLSSCLEHMEDVHSK